MSGKIRSRAVTAARAVAISTAALGIAGMLLAGAGVAAPSTAPSYSATLSHKSSCTLTTKATWKNVQVDYVVAMWYLDGVYAITSDTATPSSNATLTSRSASFPAGPFVKTLAPHEWQARVQFYNGGAQLAEVMTNVDTSSCGVA
jgi:hypothetical protein